MKERNEFKDFECNGWQRSVEHYDNSFSKVTKLIIPPLLDTLKIKRGESLLDVACGPGYVSLAAVERGASAIGIDFSDLMVEKAKQLYPGLDIRKRDAENLDFDDASFDNVAMNFGLLHLGYPEKAIAEVRRVLKPEGRFAFTIWATPDEALSFGIVLRAIEKHGDLKVPLPPAPPFFTYSDPAVSCELLQRYQFDDVTAEKIPLSWKLSSGREFFNAYYHGTPRTGGLLRAQDSRAIDKIQAEIEEEVDTLYRNGAGVEIPTPAWIFAGVKAG